jgi:hypothetical protein
MFYGISIIIVNQLLTILTKLIKKGQSVFIDLQYKLQFTVGSGNQKPGQN